MTDQEFLSQVEYDLVVQFNQNVPMKEAVKKVMLAGIYEHLQGADVKADVLGNRALWFVSNFPNATNAEVGENIRALYHGLNALANAYSKIDNYTKVEPKEPKPNRAR